MDWTKRQLCPIAARAILCESSSTSFFSFIDLHRVVLLCFVLVFFSENSWPPFLWIRSQKMSLLCIWEDCICKHLQGVHSAFHFISTIDILEYNWNILDIKGIFSEPAQCCVLAARFEMIGVPCERQKILTHWLNIWYLNDEIWLCHFQCQGPT